MHAYVTRLIISSLASLISSRILRYLSELAEFLNTSISKVSSMSLHLSLYLARAVCRLCALAFEVVYLGEYDPSGCTAYTFVCVEAVNGSSGFECL